MSYKNTKDDFLKHLKTQIRFLELSAKAYDEGFQDEAQRLATTLRVLLHDTDMSTSLLTHLNVKKKTYFASSVHQYIPANSVSYLGFLTLRTAVGEEGHYIPNCKTEDSIQSNGYLLKIGGMK